MSGLVANEMRATVAISRIIYTQQLKHGLVSVRRVQSSGDESTSWAISEGAVVAGRGSQRLTSGWVGG